MGIAFVILFPLGGVIIRLLSSILPARVKLHYGVQLFAVMIVLIAMGLGIYLSTGSTEISFRMFFTFKSNY
jgi:hypothetical protein